MVVEKDWQKRCFHEITPLEYNYKSGFFLDFEERYAINGRLLGRSIPFKYEDCFIVITIPGVQKEGFIPTLGIPGLFEAYGIDTDDWGKINNYQDLNKPETIRVWLSSVFVSCHAQDPKSLLQSAVVQSLSKRVVYALQIINPDAIRVQSDEVANNLCEIKHSVSFTDDGRPQIEISITSVIDDGKGALTMKDIKTAIKNANKTVAAPYEILGNARMNLVRNDTRAAVLNCATSLEVMLKRKVADYFDTTKTAGELQEYVLRQVDGYAKLVDLCKKLKISLSGLSDVQDSVMKIRNRVIHGGYVPTYEEAYKAYSVARIALSVVHVPVFE